MYIFKQTLYQDLKKNCVNELDDEAFLQCCDKVNKDYEDKTQKLLKFYFDLRDQMESDLS